MKSRMVITCSTLVPHRSKRAIVDRVAIETPAGTVHLTMDDGDLRLQADHNLSGRLIVMPKDSTSVVVTTDERYARQMLERARTMHALWKDDITGATHRHEPLDAEQQELRRILNERHRNAKP